MNRRFFMIFLALFPAIHLAGQKLVESNFDFYSTASGMSHNYISGIRQDSTGYMWISTSSGLNRFNGTRFVQFHSNTDTASLNSEELRGISWLDKNRLAVYTSGLHIVDTKTGSTRNIFIPYHDQRFQFKFNMMIRALGDEKGHTYVLTRSGFYHYDQNDHLISRFDYYSEKEVPVTHFFFGRELFELDSRRLLIIGIDGMYVYDKEKRMIKKMTASDAPVMEGLLSYPYPFYTFFQHKPGNFFVLKASSDSLVYLNTIENRKTVSRLPFNPGPNEFHYRSGLFADSDTLFYVTGHNSGFYKMRFFPETGALTFYPEKYFGSYLCTGLLRDRDKNLWIATNRGLFRQNNQKAMVEVIHLPAGIEQSFPNIWLDDIHVSDKKIYAGARGMGGLFVYDKKTLEFEKQVLYKEKDNRANHIRSILPVDRSHLLLGTNGSLLLFDQESRKEKELMPPYWAPLDWSGDLYKDSRGTIWIGSSHIYKYNHSANSFELIPPFAQLLEIPFVIDEDTAGHIWMSGHGLARYNTRLKKYDIFLDSFPFIKMPDKQVNAMVIDHHNSIWFNSNNNGLINYDISTGKYRHFTRSNGLPDDNIASLIVVGNRLWIACYSGIACMDLGTSNFISFGKEDGFPEMPIQKGAKFFYDKELKQLYIGFTTAFARFNPDEIVQKKAPPRTFIENLTINGEKNTFLPGDHVTTSWKENEIRITIGTINFSDGAMQRFAYRIVKDSNTAWTQMGTQPSFSISSLSPGTHRIQVKAFAPNNRWPEQVNEISIEVLPPVWQKDWFLLLAGFIVLVLLYLFIKWRTRVARSKEMEKTQVEKLKADHYKNQFELEQISNYFSSSLADKKTEDEVLWDVAQNLIGRMNYEDCIIYLWNESKTKMVQKAAYGPKGKPEVISSQVFDVLPGQGIVGHVIDTRQPMLVHDTRKEKRYRVDDDFRLSEVCVPIIHNNELLGIIDSEHHLPHYFSDRDIKILTTIATLIGNKLKQIESEQSLSAKHRELVNINEQLAEARLSALQAQMNPHFVFNALNSIKRMILEGDNDRASRYLSKFAQMIRMTLNHSREVFVTLDENITYLRAYLDMEQLRFDDSFTYRIYTSENIDLAETAIPSMMIQPLVENAIWHGLLQSEAEKKIRILFTEQKNKITCIVEDNGIGIREAEKLKQTNKSPHHSVGLENLQKRIKIMNEKYDMGCSLEITDLKESGKNRNGTRVTLQFNLINA